MAARRQIRGFNFQNRKKLASQSALDSGEDFVELKT